MKAWPAVLLCVVACEEPIDLDIAPGEPAVFIEAILTDGDDPACRVLVDKTVPFTLGQTTGAAGRSDALVVLSDDAGFRDTLTPQTYTRGLPVRSTEPNTFNHPLTVYKLAQPTTFYTSAPGWEPDVARTYTLQVTLEQQTYSATARFERPLPIDFAEPVWREDQLFQSEGWWVVFYGQEPAGLGDYTLFQLYLNDTLVQNTDNVFPAADDFVDGQYLVFDYAGPFFGLGDTVTLEAASMEQSGYNFYRTWDQLAEGVGTDPFTPPPWNAPSNFDNGAQGLFRASRVSRFVTFIPDSLGG